MAEKDQAEFKCCVSALGSSPLALFAFAGSFVFARPSLHVERGDGKAICRWNGRNANGNLFSRTDFNGHTTEYTYNNMNQSLSKAPDPLFHASGITCAYWPQGCYTTERSALRGYNGDNFNCLSGVSERAGRVSCSHDLIGNLTQVSGSAHTRNCTYDTLNPLRTLKEGRAGTTTYAYDDVRNLQTVAHPKAWCTSADTTIRTRWRVEPSLATPTA
jgi:YD repeat-containing protein